MVFIVSNINDLGFACTSGDCVIHGVAVMAAPVATNVIHGVSGMADHFADRAGYHACTGAHAICGISVKADPDATPVG